MPPIAQQIYQSLFTTDPVDGHQVEQYLADIQGLLQLTVDYTDHLLKPITIEEIMHETTRVENKVSSPGKMVSAMLFYINYFDTPPLCKTWYWRMRQMISSIINRCQTGFMPNRFIAENGLVLNMVMEHARRCNRNDIALLLDQEKAYDRAYPSYLRAAILKLGFPSTLYRGLRQDDLLSPLLFNLALEPFLQHITQDNSFLGFSFAPLSSNIPPPPALKVLAYADDVCVFLSSLEGFMRVQYYLHLYGQVSNAKVNL
ncbi:hypothetical protein G6F37_010590 [Rhizopus arrhizus]|nr:hypothetical protein G6F38_011824 [Rhizopus arrhizus]KAG1153181.1 hypothetical protein G6F37_010590 [Rhizopus arrhizus]